MRIFLHLLISYTLFQCVASHVPGYPIILVPGDGGSQLEVKLNKTSVPHYLCDKHTSQFSSIWLNIEELIPGVIDCFVDNMRLHYDREKRVSYNTEGVELRVAGFSDTTSIEYLDPTNITHLCYALSKICYFNRIVDALVQVGYKRGVSVRGAPYDFRRAPNEMGDYYKKLQALIEETYVLNNNTKVVIVAHSMGNPVSLYFFNKMSQVWKDKYVQSFVALAGVWGGAVKPMRLFSSGDDLGVFMVKAIAVRPEQRSMPSTAFLMPSDKFWNASEVLIYTDKKNYTVANYKEFFQDIDFMDGYYMRQDTENLIYDLTAPNVTVHCVHGIDMPTPAALRFRPGEFPDTYPETITGNGDGTVNLRSLLGCLRWRKEQKPTVYHKMVPGVEHMHMLQKTPIIQYVVAVALGKK